MLATKLLSTDGSGGGSPPPTTDPGLKYTSVMLHGEGTHGGTNNTFVDSSMNNFAITRNGNATQGGFSPFTKEPGKWSAYLDGTGDYITAASSAALQLGTGDFTIEYWWYSSTPSGTYTQDVGTLVSTTEAGTYRIGSRYGNTDKVYFARGTGSTFEEITYAVNINDSLWHHVALVRSSGVITLYIDGTARTPATGSTSNAGTCTSANELKIGYNGRDGVYSKGYVSNLRITKGVAVYTSGFTPTTSPLPITADTAVLLCSLNRFADASINKHTITANGDARVSTFSPFTDSAEHIPVSSNYGVYLGTGNDYVTAASNAALQLGTGDFTIEYWWYSSTPAGTYTQDVGTLVSTTEAGTYRIGSRYGNTDKVYFARGTGSTFEEITYAVNINDSVWHHVALIRSSGVITLYIDGIARTPATGSTSNAGTCSSANELKIGYNGRDNVYSKGCISNLRIVKGTAVYTANFVPPTAQLTAITNTSLLTCQSSTLKDNSTNNTTMTAYGSARVTPASPFGNEDARWGVYLDGAGDYLSLPSTAAYAFGTGDYTVEGWFYFTGTISTYQRLWFFGDDRDNCELYTSLIRVGGTGQGVMASSSAIVANTWYHIASVRSGGQQKLYINGIATGTGTANSYSSTNRTLTIGALSTGADPVTGYVSNFRVVNGTAVYTANFVPPTAPLTAITNTTTLCCQDSVMFDRSPQQRSVTANGNAKAVPWASPTVSVNSPAITGGSAYFDGTGDSLTTPSITIGTNPFCFECWVYPTATQGSPGPGLFVAASTNGLQCAYYGSAGLGIAQKGVAWAFYNASAAPVVNTWNHVAFVRSGTGTNQTSIYLNGTRVANGTVATSYGASTYAVSIVDASFSAFKGYVSNARFTNGSTPYDASMASIGVPAAPVTASAAGTSLLIDGTNGNVIDTVSGAVFETVGNAQIDTTVKKFGTSSIKFPDSTSYLVAPTNQEVAFGAGDFTVEAWVYPTSLADNITVAAANYTYATAAGDWSFYWNASYLYFNAGGTNHQSSATLTPTVNTWYHLAYSRQSGVGRFFINGAQLGTSVTDTSSYPSTGPIFIGRQSSGHGNLIGYMDEIRITKGYAAYTSAFTPPSSPYLDI